MFWSGFHMVFSFLFPACPWRGGKIPLPRNFLHTRSVLPHQQRSCRGISGWTVLDMDSLPRSWGLWRCCRLQDHSTEGDISELHTAMVLQKGKGQIPPASYRISPFDFDQSWDYVYACSKDNLDCSVLLLEPLYIFIKIWFLIML